MKNFLHIPLLLVNCILLKGGCLVVNTHGTEESEAVGGSQLFEVDLEEYTGIVEGFWIKTDFTGREHIIRIDNQKYFSKDKADFRKLTIDSVENSDAGYYVYRATDDLETVDSSPIIFLVKGSIDQDKITPGASVTLSTMHMTTKINNETNQQKDSHSTEGSIDPEQSTAGARVTDFTLQLTTKVNETKQHTTIRTNSISTDYGTQSGNEVTSHSIKDTQQTEVECPCDCEFKQRPEYWASQNLTNYTMEELRIILRPVLDKLEKELKVDKTKLSSTIRKLASAEDHRPSSKHIGYIGIIFLVSVIALVVISDVISFKQYVFKKWTNGSLSNE